MSASGVVIIATLLHLELTRPLARIDEAARREMTSSAYGRIRCDAVCAEFIVGGVLIYEMFSPGLCCLGQESCDFYEICGAPERPKN